jgi:16S rRNA (cytosine967-C5)-methyltransferase
LLYSTCSILRAENEQVIAAFLERCSNAKEQAIPSVVPVAELNVSHGMQVLPGTFDNDGFYYALLRRFN